MSVAKYYIYRNLRTGGFSVKRRGRVVDRQKTLNAQDVTFKVNEIGRQRVIKEKQKNVHAYVVCDKYYLYSRQKVDNLQVITYNPYVAANFVCNGKTIQQAEEVMFSNGKCYLLK